MINLIIDNKSYPVNMLKFSDGAKTFKVENLPDKANYLSIYVSTQTPVSEVSEEVSLLLSAISNSNIDVKSKYLYMPYLPYGRADRVFEKGNPSPLNTFLYIIERFNFTEVFIEDPHNVKSLAAHDINFNIREQYLMASEFVYKNKVDFILAPDKGAVDKATKLSNYVVSPLLTANKVRDLSTGWILSVEMDTLPTPGSTVFIVDDIMDGGGTFIPLAQTLKELDCTVLLYVTHIIASKGLKPFIDCVDKIYYKNIIGEFINETNIFKFNNK
jgi:ribose-phosphate pyrophosphokinase